MATVALRNLRKVFGKTVALDGLDVSIGDGEFFVLLGPSGAGKTTTLKCIAGLEEPTEGRIVIGDRDVTTVEPNKRRVAMAFENYALYPHLSVFDNIAFPLRSPRYRLPESEIRSRVGTTAEVLGISHLLDRLPAELSGGQRQRVSLARVLVRPADAVLLDEPLSHLDAKLRAAMRAELKSLSHIQRTTTIYVTHDYLEALALGDRIGVLRAGQLVQVGTREEIWQEPRDTFVARAFGQPEINLLKGTVVTGEDGPAFRLDGVEWTVALPKRNVPVGARVELGLRPRDLTLEHGDSSASARTGLRFPGRVYVVEPLGRELEVTVNVGSVQVAVVVDGQIGDWPLDAPVTVIAPPDRVLLFDEASTLRIA
ncbi:MAG TPA: ABC transporter ATP-binding protein [Thermomicrobiales bacterium]